MLVTEGKPLHIHCLDLPRRQCFELVDLYLEDGIKKVIHQ